MSMRLNFVINEMSLLSRPLPQPIAYSRRIFNAKLCVRHVSEKKIEKKTASDQFMCRMYTIKKKVELRPR